MNRSRKSYFVNYYLTSVFISGFAYNNESIIFMNVSHIEYGQYLYFDTVSNNLSSNFMLSYVVQSWYFFTCDFNSKNAIKKKDSLDQCMLTFYVVVQLFCPYIFFSILLYEITVWLSDIKFHCVVISIHFLPNLIIFVYTFQFLFFLHLIGPRIV